MCGTWITVLSRRRLSKTSPHGHLISELGFCAGIRSPRSHMAYFRAVQKAPYYRGYFWSEREDLNLRPLVSQTSALTGLRHAPMPFP